MNTKILTLLLAVTFASVTHDARSQARSTKSAQQLWLGYLTTTRLNDRYALWNDFHFVPKGFFVARTGITRHIKRVNLTAGYAFLLLPSPTNTSELKRKEHRPWAQLDYALPVSKSIVLIQRYRYEARFKQDIVSESLVDTYTFSNRVRYLAGLRKNFKVKEGTPYTPFVFVADEVLLNFGKHITYNTFDQNRIILSLGVQTGSMQFQTGYMSRFVQTGPSKFTNNNTLFFWVYHNIGFKKQAPKVIK